jgi:hypothetical protein
LFAHLADMLSLLRDFIRITTNTTAAADSQSAINWRIEAQHLDKKSGTDVQSQFCRGATEGPTAEMAVGGVICPEGSGGSNTGAGASPTRSLDHYDAMTAVAAHRSHPCWRPRQFLEATGGARPGNTDISEKETLRSARDTNPSFLPFVACLLTSSITKHE